MPISNGQPPAPIVFSLWGKFGTKNKLLQTEIIQSPERFHRLIFGENYHVLSVQLLQDAGVLVEFKCLHQEERPFKQANIGVAIMTTTFARLYLLKALEKLGDRLVYCDTDS